jgi:transposase InsO family protein
MITEHQYQRLMKEYTKTAVLSTAAMKAGMHRETAAKYLTSGQGPQPERKRGRRRPDPLTTIWPAAERLLGDAPEVEAKALFEHLLARSNAPQAQKALRTFQRRVLGWRRLNGPPREVFFPQVREPGASLQLDWTHAAELEVRIAGQRWEQLLCHAVLPYSNWEWAVPCRSESMLSLKHGLQAALWTLGGVPLKLQTDHSSTATHVLSRMSGQRGFNVEYLALCRHLGLEPCTINPSRPHENGDIESANGHLKRRLKTHLTLRGSREFADEAAFARFVAEVCTGANLLRTVKLGEERPRLRPLPATRYPETDESRVRVSSYSTVRVKHCAYSVPAKLIGAMVQVQISEAELVVRHDGIEVARYPRSLSHQARIDYRHVIASLVRKPGAFAGYIYREELFPRTAFRQAYDALVRADPPTADRHYVRLLALAAERGEDEVATALGTRLRAASVPWPQDVEAALQAPTSTTVELTSFTPELQHYDALIGEASA